MSEILTIEGKRFIGNFRANRRIGEFWRGSEYTECKYEGYWYEGAGIIEDLHTGEKYFFVLETPHFEDRQYISDGNYTLEEAIVNYNQKGPYYAGDFKPRLVDGAYRKIVDIILDEMASKVKQSEEDIPLVKPKRLETEYLITMGYCADEKGQLNFQFST